MEKSCTIHLFFDRSIEVCYNEHMDFANKYHLLLKEILFLFKKHLSSVVYTSLKMGNRNIEFPEKEVLYEKLSF